MPFGSFTGHLYVDGTAERIQGSAYVDHNSGMGHPIDHVRSWRWISLLGRRNALTLCACVPFDARSMQKWVLLRTIAGEGTSLRVSKMTVPQSDLALLRHERAWALPDAARREAKVAIVSGPLLKIRRRRFPSGLIANYRAWRIHGVIEVHGQCHSLLGVSEAFWRV